MEITSKLSNLNSIYTPQNPQIHRQYGCFCSKSSTVRLPLHRPRRKILRPQKLISTVAGTTASSSDVLRLLDCLGLPVPDAVYTSLIKECTHSRDSNEAVLLHGHITRNRRSQIGLALVNRILIMLVSCGCIQNAHQMFDEMTKRDLNSWAIMIAGYADIQDYEEVINFFVNSVQQHFIDRNSKFPVSWILVCVLKACANTLNLKLGKQIHGWLLKSGYSEDFFLSSSLINFYGKTGCYDCSNLVFNQVSYPNNVVIWTARIVNNCKKERFHQVLEVFNEMGKEGVRKNSFTFSSVLSACAKMRDGSCGEQVHANAIKLGLASKGYVQCGLVNMYGKFGLIRDAKKVFDMNGNSRNSACWNAMFTGLIQHGCRVEAIKFLYKMKAAGVQPRDALVNELWSLCGSEVLETGRHLGYSML